MFEPSKDQSMFPSVMQLGTVRCALLKAIEHSDTRNPIKTFWSIDFSEIK